MVHTLPDYTSKWRSDTPTFNINSSEVSRRINQVSSPDGRGRVRWFDDMQGIYNGWEHQTMLGGSAEVTIDRPYTGDQAHRLTTSAVAGSISRMIKTFSPGVLPRIGVEAIFCVIDNDGTFDVQFSCSDDTHYALSELRCDIKNNRIQLRTFPAAGWVTIGTQNFSDLYPTYLTSKLVGDFSTGMYVRAIINGVEIDLSGHTWTKTAGAYLYRTCITLAGGNIDAEICKYNVGACFLTDQEP